MTVQLSQAIISKQPFAADIAISMGKPAIAELAALTQHSQTSIRMDALRILQNFDLQDSYNIVFAALEEQDINIVHTGLSIIEKHQSQVSSTILAALLEKLHFESAKISVLLMLGTKLENTPDAQHLNERQIMQQYCSIEHGENLALHAVTALAKAGDKRRRQQFSAYVNSLHSSLQQLASVMSLIDYIRQPWLLPTLRQLLQNKKCLHALEPSIPGTPKELRVCDLAVLAISQICHQAFSFTPHPLKNFSDVQLEEAAKVASQMGSKLYAHNVNQTSI
ncbi:hypothetical protein [Glaciecola sp. 1036]|uniref:hypothetical protein n=1 Tax=Alteromonadaceae TaxID=72275 RepID=UPI003D025441